VGALCGATMSSDAPGTALLAPLLDPTAAATDDDDTDSAATAEWESIPPRTPQQIALSLLVYAGLTGGAAMSVAAMVLAPMTAIFAMGLLCVANAPYAAVKEWQIGRGPGIIRDMNVKLQEVATRLEEEVTVLGEEVDVLGPEAERAWQAEEQLRSRAAAQGVSATKLVGLVKENAAILVKMRDNLRQRVVQDIIHIVLRSDEDHDGFVNAREAKILALMIRVELAAYDVLFDDNKFLAAIVSCHSSCPKDHTSVTRIIATVSRILPKEQRSGDRNGNGDDDEEDGEDIDMYDMFHMAEEGAPALGGSQGKGVSLLTCDRKKCVRRRKERSVRKKLTWVQVRKEEDDLSVFCSMCRPDARDDDVEKCLSA